ncbi:MAG: hypothetical protein HY677_07350 [Chloroflexi bacterium]|nr:hypothetical protein [Chloroflexota bacterium]
MRFLVITKMRHPLPPQSATALMDAMGSWRDRHADHIEQIWSFAGIPGGAGIANVNSLEELDGVMAEFPLAPFSEIEVLPLVDFEGSIDRARQAMQAMAVGGRQ